LGKSIIHPAPELHELQHLRAWGLPTSLPLGVHPTIFFVRSKSILGEQAAAPLARGWLIAQFFFFGFYGPEDDLSQELGPLQQRARYALDLETSINKFKFFLLKL
jgi:hypothetical protein